MALGDVIASMPLVKQGLFFTCRGGVLASLATGVRPCMPARVCVCQPIAVNVAPGKQSWLPQRFVFSGAAAPGIYSSVYSLSLHDALPIFPLLFVLWRVHVRMALGDVIASMPLVKQGLFVVCRGGALASLVCSLCVRSKQFRRQ